MTYHDDFGPFEEAGRRRIWLNAAHQGPLPRVAVAEARDALQWKIAPHRISDDAFLELPRRLRTLLARLVGASPDEIILGNSASHGLNVLANGLRWSRGDEVLVLANDFPATVFSWFIAERRGARIRQLQLHPPQLTAERLSAELAPRTRVVCLSWVHSLTGHVLDLAALGHVCAQAGVLFVVNATQGLGNRPLNVGALPLAALTSSGFKWLCGPYATGFSWIRPDVLEQLEPIQSYWLALPDDAGLDLNDEGEHRPRTHLGARGYDVFGTANFLNFMPWAAALEYLLEQGIDQIAAHDAALVRRIVESLPRGINLISPGTEEERSAIVVMSHADRSRNPQTLRALAEAGVDVALRGGNIRISPHLYNTTDEIDGVLTVLAAAAAAP
jgi:cysteine desulfurase / selenocysteine lyase